MRYTAIIFLLLLAGLTAVSQQAEFEWAVQCGNPPNTTDTKTTLAAADGDFFMAGEFLDVAVFGDKSLVSAGGTDIFLVKHSAQGVPEWASRIGSVDYDYVQRIIASDDGHVLMAGYFYGSTLIGTDEYTSFGSQDVFLAAFDPDGNFLWSERAGGMMADYISAIEVDPEGNILVTGYFYGEFSIGDTTVQATASSDIYLARFSPAGSFEWVVTAGGSSSDQARSLSCDPEGNVLLTGSFYYDFNVGDTTLTTTNPVGVVIAQFYPDGQLLQTFQLEGTYLTPETYIHADHAGNFYVSGNFSEQIFFGDKTFTAGPFNQDLFVAKYGQDAKLQWARHAFSPSSDQVISMDIDPYNNLYITGHYLDTIQFDQLTIPYTLCCGSREVFIVNYSFDGQTLWGKQISGARASVQSSCMDENGSLLLSGLFTEDVFLGPLTLSNFTGYRNFITSLATDMYTGAPEIAQKEPGLQIYPNPAVDHFYIGQVAAKDPVPLKIYNSSGLLIRSGMYISSSGMNIEDLKPGIYFITVEDVAGDGIFGGKFIKL